MSERSGDEMQAFAVDDASRRRHRRWFVDFKSSVTVGDETLDCAVYDLSPGGACVEIPGPSAVAVGDRLAFVLPGYGAIPAEVRYSGGGYLGLMFLHGGEGEVEVARYLVAIEHSRRPERHDVKMETVLRASGVDLACVLDDISRMGALVLADETRHINVGQEVTLELPDTGPIPAIVQRVDERAVGVAFLKELDRVPGQPAEDADSD